MSPKVTEYIKWLNAQNIAPNDTPAPHIDDPEVQEYIKSLNTAAAVTPPTPARPAYTPPPKPVEQPLSKSNARFLLLYAAIIGLTFSVCFSGWDVKPYLSLPVFAIIAFIAGIFVLKSVGKLVSNKAWLWFIPIFFTALPNALFGETARMWPFDIAALHLLFAAFGLSATGQSLKGMFRLIFTNPFYRFHIIKTAFGGDDTEQGATKKIPKIIGQVALGLLIALVPVIIIIAILASADAAFAEFVGNVIDAILRIDIFRWIWNIIVFGIATLYTMNYIFKACFVKYPEQKAAESTPRKVYTFASVAIISSLNLVYIAFACVRIEKLFSNVPVVSQAYDYASLARNGFFQLLFVSAINFGVIALYLWLLRGHKEQKVLKTLLSFLCVLTGVLIADSFMRVFFYISNNGYTPLRLAVVTFLCFEAALISIGFYYIWIQGKRIIQMFALVSLIFLIIASYTFTQQLADLLNTGSLLLISGLEGVSYWQNIRILQTAQKFNFLI